MILWKNAPGQTLYTQGELRSVNIHLKHVMKNKTKNKPEFWIVAWTSMWDQNPAYFNKASSFILTSFCLVFAFIKWQDVGLGKYFVWGRCCIGFSLFVQILLSASSDKAPPAITGSVIHWLFFHIHNYMSLSMQQDKMGSIILWLLMSGYSILLNGPTKRLVSNTAAPGHIIILLKTYTIYFCWWIFLCEGGRKAWV